MDRINAARPYTKGRYTWNEEKKQWVPEREISHADREKYIEIRWVVSRHYQAVLAPEGGSLHWNDNKGKWVPDKYERSQQPKNVKPKTGTFSLEDLSIVQNHFHELILEITEPWKDEMKGNVKLPSISNELFCKGLRWYVPACAYLIECKLSERNGKPLLTVNSMCRFNDADDYYEITIEGCVLVDVD
jgi:hypothetical protein